MGGLNLFFPSHNSTGSWGDFLDYTIQVKLDLWLRRGIGDGLDYPRHLATYGSLDAIRTDKRREGVLFLRSPYQTTTHHPHKYRYHGDRENKTKRTT